MPVGWSVLNDLTEHLAVLQMLTLGFVSDLHFMTFI